MMIFNNGFLEVLETEGYLLEEKFYSKKNNVYKVRCLEVLEGQKVVVIKKYLQPSINIKREIALLLHLREKGLSVPEIYFKENEYIIMEYIEGKTLLEAMEERERKNLFKKGYPYQSNEHLICTLIEWLEKFYHHTNGKLILTDINLRNFIINNNGVIYGFDFEDCDAGRIEEDAAKLCAYILTYDPSFSSWKLQFTREVFYLLLKKFHLNDEVLLKEVEKEITNINRKRGKCFSIELFSNTIK